jgi:tyrosyl-tRNA synthetase
VFGLEAMAAGNAVLMSAQHEHFPYEFNDAWMETEDWQLYDNLKYLLDYPEKIAEYAKSGYEYMTNNFSIYAIKKHLSSIFMENGLIFQCNNSNDT